MNQWQFLLRRARWNSGLLAFMFLSNGVSDFAGGSPILGLLGVLVCGLCVMDVFTFHEALKNLTDGEKNG
jgi:hypothetical protein